MSAGHLGQGVADGRVVAGGGQVVGGVIAVVPTVVRDEGVGPGSGFLKVGIGGRRPGIGIGSHDEELGGGRQAAELEVGGRHG